MRARRRGTGTQPDRRPAAACEVWWATPTTNPGLAELLDDAELRRAGRLRHLGDRDRFVTTRALLRLVLAMRTGAAPSGLHLDTTCHRCGADHGKPRLIGGGGSASFSVTHSGDRVAVAVADDVSVGVDVESAGAREPADLAVLATGILAPAELADYQLLAPSRRRRALAVWWTRKEAVLKATGDGLTVPMREVAVTAPDQPAALRQDRGTRRPAMAALRDLTPGDGAVACVAALQVSSLAVTERDGDELLARVAPAEPPVATTLS